MRFARSSGILLHPTSLPGRFGIGDLGSEAYRFVDYLAAAGQKLWQVLPLGPTGYGDSPYQLFSAFAGNPLLISLEQLVAREWLASSDLEGAPGSDDAIDYGRVIEWKLPLLKQAAARFRERAGRGDREQFSAFCERHAGWLDDFALFMAVKQAHGGAVWSRWDAAIACREPGAVRRWVRELDAEVQAWRFTQFAFFEQWETLKRYSARRGIRIVGDVPIYVAHDSAEVWARPELFQLDERGDPVAVAGVPPDYFSATGQLWGNPLYRWDALAKEGYHWWIERLRAAFARFDIVRLDHFRGFEAYWRVPAGEPTAIHGEWVKGPGAAFFEAAERALGDLPVIAENLGVITPEVEAIRRQFRFPGMAILQFAFGTDPQAPDFRPHNYPRELAAYSGTHDNDTTVGWWTGAGAGESTRSEDDVVRERAFALRYLGTDGADIHWVVLRTLLASVADTVLFPLQDALGLGSEARMNVPGRPAGNWRWRYRPEALTDTLCRRLRELTATYDR